jgi:hypothetical protein
LIYSFAVCSSLFFAVPSSAQYPPPWQQALPQGQAILVRNWYLRFLNREPDPQGLNGWTNALLQGSPPAQVLTGILGSQEYYQRAGSTPEGFVVMLYRDLFYRDPSNPELVHWARRMAFHGGPAVAYEILVRHPQAWQ